MSFKLQFFVERLELISCCSFGVGGDFLVLLGFFSQLLNKISFLSFGKMVNVFCILKVQVIHSSTYLRIQIINRCDNLLAVVVHSTSLSGF